MKDATYAVLKALVLLGDDINGLKRPRNLYYVSLLSSMEFGADMTSGLRRQKKGNSEITDFDSPSYRV